MAAPLRVALNSNFSRFSTFSHASHSLVRRDRVSICRTFRYVHNARVPESKPLFSMSNRFLRVSGFIVSVVAGCTTLYSFTMIGTSLVDAARRKFIVRGADSIIAKPDHKVSREIRRSTDDTGLKLTLYQYQTCPFCCKVRAFLDYHGISYDVVEVNSVTRKQLKWTKYPKVPILIVDGVGENGFLQLNDSSVIISILKTYLFHRNNGDHKSLDDILKCYPMMETMVQKKTVFEFPNKYFIMYFDATPDGSKEAMKEERKWRNWTDETFVHVLSPNIYRTMSESLSAFKYFSKVGQWEKEFSTLERAIVVYVGSIAMYFVGKVLKKRHNIDDDVRLALYREVNIWLKAKGNKRRFLGGDTPNLADLSVYGSLVAIEGCEAFQDLLQNTKVSTWYTDMKDAVTSHNGYKMAAKKS